MPAVAAPWTVGGAVTVRAGVDANPFLTTPSRGATGTGGVSGRVTATREAPKSTTNILASADYSGYVSKYGSNRNFFVALQRFQTLTEHLKLAAVASYTNTISPQANFGFDPTLSTAPLDYLTIGTRTQRVDGSVNLDWQASDRDTFRIGGFASHATYSSAIASNNDQYGGTFSYLRRVDAKTQVGVVLAASKVQTDLYPSSSTRSVLGQLVRQIGPYWVFDGSIGVVQARSGNFIAPGIASRGNRTTLAFNGSLCGNYPRSTYCFTFSRQAAPSGIGGLRTDTNFGVAISHALTEHSRLTFSGAYDLSTSIDNVLVPRQRFYTATAGYNRDLSQRISVGVVGVFQRRELDATSIFPGSSPSQYGLSVTASYAFGRLGR